MDIGVNIIQQLSAALADQVAAATPLVVALRTGPKHRTGILWRPDVVVTSEQVVGDADAAVAVGGGTEVQARLAGRDPATNVAVFRLESTFPATAPTIASQPATGSLALVIGADAAGAATGRLAMVHATGPAWHSMAGGRIDALIRLDARLGADEGGPVLDATGALLGMSTAGPRRRALVIPAATIERVLTPLLERGRVAQGWLGVGLQPVSIPDSLRPAAGQPRGAMVVRLATNAPAEQAGILPGDILLMVNDFRFGERRGLAALMTADRIGQPVTVRLLRGGEAREIAVVITARPES